MARGATTTGLEEKDPYLLFGRLRFNPKWVQKPYSDTYFRWLVTISCAVWYNLILIVPRAVFHEIHEGPQVYFFLFMDYFCDLLYLLDMGIKMITGFIENGILIREPRKLIAVYRKSMTFKMDILSILPTDLLYLQLGWYAPYPIVRINRIIRLSRVGDFYYRAQTRLDSPNTFRLIYLILTMIVVVHLNACVYYYVSSQVGIGLDRWAYPGKAGWRIIEEHHGSEHGSAHGGVHGGSHGEHGNSSEHEFLEHGGNLTELLSHDPTKLGEEYFVNHGHEDTNQTVHGEISKIAHDISHSLSNFDSVNDSNGTVHQAAALHDTGKEVHDTGQPPDEVTASLEEDDRIPGAPVTHTTKGHGLKFSLGDKPHSISSPPANHREARSAPSDELPPGISSRRRRDILAHSETDVDLYGFVNGTTRAHVAVTVHGPSDLGSVDVAVSGTGIKLGSFLENITSANPGSLSSDLGEIPVASIVPKRPTQSASDVPLWRGLRELHARTSTVGSTGSAGDLAAGRWFAVSSDRKFFNRAVTPTLEIPDVSTPFAGEEGASDAVPDETDEIGRPLFPVHLAFTGGHESSSASSDHGNNHQFTVPPPAHRGSGAARPERTLDIRGRSINGEETTESAGAHDPSSTHAPDSGAPESRFLHGTRGNKSSDIDASAGDHGAVSTGHGTAGSSDPGNETAHSAANAHGEEAEPSMHGQSSDGAHGVNVHDPANSNDPQGAHGAGTSGNAHGSSGDHGAENAPGSHEASSHGSEAHGPGKSEHGGNSTHGDGGHGENAHGHGEGGQGGEGLGEGHGRAAGQGGAHGEGAEHGEGHGEGGGHGEGHGEGGEGEAETGYKKPIELSSRFENDTLLKKYSYCLYWSVKMMTSKPYELANPTTTVQFIFHIFDAFLGIFMFASIVGEVDGIIERINKASDDFKEKLDSVKQYISMRKVGREMESRVVKWFDYVWANNGSLDEDSVLAVLPEYLRMEIARHVHLDVLKKVPIFQGIDEQFLLELAEKLRFEAFCPGDYVCRKGDIGREIYVVRRGLLNVIAADGVKVIVTLKSGVVFGELSLLNVPGSANGNRRTVTVRTVGYADLFSLSKEAFWSCLEEYPEVKELLMDKARKILQKDNLFNEEAAREAARRGRNFGDVAGRLEENLDIISKRLTRFWQEQIEINQSLLSKLEKLEIAKKEQRKKLAAAAAAAAQAPEVGDLLDLSQDIEAPASGSNT